MRYLLDTNICIYVIKRKPARTFRELRARRVGDVGISIVTYCELCYGVENSADQERNLVALQEFVAPLEVLDLGADVASVYGRIRAALRRAGTPIGPLDTLIAAHAVALGLTLVTNNLKEFRRVPGLQAEDWS